MMEKHNFLNSSITPKNVFEVLGKNNIKQKCGDEIFDLCLWLIMWLRTESLKFKTENIPVSSLLLRKICSHHDKQVIKILIDSGIIVRTNEANYFKNKSNEYSISKEFAVSKANPLIPRYYRSDVLIRRIARNYRNELKQNKLNRNLQNNFLYKMLNEKLSYDSDRALEYIMSTYQESSPEFKLRFEIINYISEGFIWGHYAKH